MLVEDSDDGVLAGWCGEVDAEGKSEMRLVGLKPNLRLTKLLTQFSYIRSLIGDTCTRTVAMALTSETREG